jgi:hypothetical protein
MPTIIQCNLSDAQSVINDARIEWVFNTLRALKIPEDVLNEKNIDNYRSEMESLGVEVVYSTSGQIDVYKKTRIKKGEDGLWLPAEKENLIAQWKEPRYAKKIDESGVYYEIHLNEWSMFK